MSNPKKRKGKPKIDSLIRQNSRWALKYAGRFHEEPESIVKEAMLETVSFLHTPQAVFKAVLIEVLRWGLDESYRTSHLDELIRENQGWAISEARRFGVKDPEEVANQAMFEAAKAFHPLKGDFKPLLNTILIWRLKSAYRDEHITMNQRCHYLTSRIFQIRAQCSPPRRKRVARESATQSAAHGGNFPSATNGFCGCD